MHEKYDLALLLKEIEEDVRDDSRTAQTASQDDIERLIAEKQGEKEKKP